MDKTEKTIEQISEFIEQNLELTPEMCEKLSAGIDDNEHLTELLPKLKELHVSYKALCDENDSRVKIFNESKKGWKSKDERLVQLVGYLLKKFGLTSFSAGDAKASIRSTAVLEVTNENALLKDYQNSMEFASLKASLPSWVKLNLTIDKSALNSYIKMDSSLLVTHPEWLSTRENTSVTLK